MLNKNSRGIITTYALVFGAIFLILFAGFLGFVLLQLKQASQKAAWNESLHIAEAGINYWRWCLNNDVEDQCETEKEYTDPAGNPIGKFSLQVSSQANCGQTVSKDIVSTGWTYQFPNMKRRVGVLYGRTSVGKYSYLINDNVWAGSDREIRGPYHSNGGVRMDGENQSLVSSAQEEWVCTDSFGCSPCPTDAGCRIEDFQCICPGVFTTTDNSNPDLFDFPVPSFDFDGITVDLAQIRSLTQPYPEQYYWPPIADLDSDGKGYHVKFVNNGTFEVWIITDLQPTWAYNLEDGWHYDYFIIGDEYLYGTYSIDPDCSAIFVEDNLWVDGEVKGKVTIVSADLIDSGKDTSVVLSGNINYTTLDGSDGFAVVGQKDVLIPPDSPDTMELRGIFIAQKGHFGRNHYPWNIKSKLEIYGSVISNGRVGTKWSSGSIIISGYLKRENYFDSHLVYFPPPFVPYVESDFKILNWQEIE